MEYVKATSHIHAAAKVLGIVGDINPDSIDAAYKRAAMKYHPDKNPGGLVMMQAINAARETLRDFRGSLGHKPEAANYGPDLNEAINYLITCLGLDLEICGAWLWVSGNTKSFKDYIKAFETESKNKFKWHSKKGKWYFAPNDYKGFRRFKSNVAMDDIRSKYGSEHVQIKARTAISN